MRNAEKVSENWQKLEKVSQKMRKSPEICESIVKAANCFYSQYKILAHNYKCFGLVHGTNPFGAQYKCLGLVFSTNVFCTQYKSLLHFCEGGGS